MTANDEKSIIRKLPLENYGPGTPIAKELHACWTLCYKRMSDFAQGDLVVENNMKLALSVRLCADVTLAMKDELRGQFLKELSASHVEAVKLDMKAIEEWLNKVEAAAS